MVASRSRLCSSSPAGGGLARPNREKPLFLRIALLNSGSAVRFSASTTRPARARERMISTSVSTTPVASGRSDSTCCWSGVTLWCRSSIITLEVAVKTGVARVACSRAARNTSRNTRANTIR